MNNETILLLEKYFDVAFAAPDGVKKLRELILSLAMQGKLVPQDPSDQSARELLKEIEAEKSRLVKDGKIKASKPLPEIKPDEVPYDLPKSWEWVRLGEIGETNIGLTYAPSDISDIGTPVLRSNNVQNGKLDLTDLKRVNKDVKENVLVQQGDLLICARNGSKALVGKTALITGLTENMAFGAFMAIFRSRVNEYLLYFINSPLFRTMIDEVNTMTINQITQNNLKSTIFPLPPIAEQRRIVAKIDELMARCDELEKLRQVHAQKQITVHNAALNQLLTGKDHNDFKTSWHFITQHFGELYSVKANVTELRKAILQLAVMGKLVPQDPNDQPDSELLKQIEKEKQKLIKEGKIKASKSLPEIKPDKIPYNLPQGWEWVQFEHIAENSKNALKAGPFGSALKKSMYVPSGFKIYGQEQVISGDENLGNYFIDSEKYSALESCAVKSGDILISLVGTIGKVLVLSKSCQSGIINPRLVKISLYCDVNREFIKRLLSSPVIQMELSNNSHGGTMNILNLGLLRDIRLPLPPLAEQHRIVAKIDQLMTLCDELEKQIDIANSKKTNLLNSVMTKI